ncbi:BrxA/BrxB family bacilliredoxin [Pseudalkalibacillus hwajinpoensis]|uniref:BrxA/BrxB family bacilliredoxin n=1 Tax=Guptibacillus hwajinpoensis TaxID=208199 RepID=UPI00325AD87A
MSMDFNLFMNDVVATAREEIKAAGYEELTTPEAVEEVVTGKGTTLVMVNSVCGCAGGVARPAARMAIANEKTPDKLVTVFAGQDKEATAKARSYFAGFAPSSPSFALLKDGNIINMVERHEIEGSDPEEVSGMLQYLFNKYC